MQLLKLSAYAGSCAVCAVTAAGTITFDAPTFDRWNYPFNGNAGNQTDISTFSSIGGGFEFDDRDAQFLVTYVTSGDVTPGLQPYAYEVVSATLRMETAVDLSFVYDDTSDPYTAFLPAEDLEFSPDADPGQPLELFGTAFRNGFTAASYGESGPYSLVDPIARSVRNAHAMGFDGTGAAIDVSNNVFERFDPTPWAVGTITGVSPGANVPVASEVVFNVNLADANIQNYFRESLNEGILSFSVTSLTQVEVMGGDFPSFFSKENPLALKGFVSAATLELEVEIDTCPSDIDGDTIVGFNDLLIVLSTYTVCPGTGPCAGDINGDGTRDFSDLLLVLSNWGPCPS